MIGLGCMRLSTLAERDDERGIAVIRAALDAGATLLDTADAYCLNADDTGHNERLVARALEGWKGDRSPITVATKGGMRRPKGAWVPDGRAKHLRDACEASRRALGVESIDLYQLHVVDPKTPIETSVRALAKLRDDGLVRAIGLCNVTVGQIAAAREIATISAVQVSLSPFDDESLRNGVAEYCRENDIRLIAHRPLGGERVKRLAKDPVLVAIAAKHEATPQEIALAWLMSCDAVTLSEARGRHFALRLKESPPRFAQGDSARFAQGDSAQGDRAVVPIPGATRAETAASIGRALQVRLHGEDIAALDDRFSGRLLRVPRAERRPRAGRGDVVLIMGMPGAGKSTIAASLERDGFDRLNRDAVGGSLADLLPRLDSLLAGGRDRVVLDNTYPTRASRNEVVETAWRRGATVRCIWLTTSVADAQINSIRRMIGAHGSLPSREEIKARAKADPRFLLPDAQFRFERTVEPPSADEGFERIETIEFRRDPDKGETHALIFDFDDLAARDPAALARYRDEGWVVFAHAWRPGGESVPALPESFGSVDVAMCPHEAGPPVCWCRKPIPGSVLEFAARRNVNLSGSIVVGSSAAGRTMAERIGARFEPGDTFFG